MPYNYNGNLYKIEIVQVLQDKEYYIKSVHVLNKLIEKIGLLIYYGDT